MKALNNKLTVRAGLTLSFLAVAVIAAVIGLFSVNALNRVGDLAGQMNNRETAGVYYVGQADAHLIAAGSSARSAILAQTASERDFEVSMVEEHFEELYRILGKAQGLFVTEAGKQQVTQTREAVQAYEGALKEMLEVLAVHADRAQEILMLHAQPLGDVAQQQMEVLVNEKRDNAGRFGREIDAVGARAEILMFSLTAAGVVLALLLGWLISRRLTRQLGGEPADVARVASSIAQGDLTTDIQ